MIIQFCGMSGSGKTTLAYRAKQVLSGRGLSVEVIDGDEYRQVLCSDLGFSKDDRNTNIRRLSFVASKLSKHNVIAIICAINPYEAIRNEITSMYPNSKTVFVDCPLNVLIQRDTKGLYQRALLPDGHADKITNLTGVNDPFEIPQKPDLIIYSGWETVDESCNKLVEFILQSITKAAQVL